MEHTLAISNEKSDYEFKGRIVTHKCRGDWCPTLIEPAGTNCAQLYLGDCSVAVYVTFITRVSFLLPHEALLSKEDEQYWTWRLMVQDGAGKRRTDCIWRYVWRPGAYDSGTLHEAMLNPPSREFRKHYAQIRLSLLALQAKAYNPLIQLMHRGEPVRADTVRNFPGLHPCIPPHATASVVIDRFTINDKMLDVTYVLNDPADVVRANAWGLCFADRHWIRRIGVAFASKPTESVVDVVWRYAWRDGEYGRGFLQAAFHRRPQPHQERLLDQLQKKIISNLEKEYEPR